MQAVLLLLNLHPPFTLDLHVTELGVPLGLLADGSRERTHAKLDQPPRILLVRVTQTERQDIIGLFDLSKRMAVSVFVLHAGIEVYRRQREDKSSLGRQSWQSAQAAHIARHVGNICL
jgi:hypothetical protein